MIGRGQRSVTRRGALIGTAAAAFLGSTKFGWTAPSVAPFTIVINQSPWLDGFRKTVELYEKETGNQVELDVNPFAGSLEKQRNSVRASSGQYDLLMMNSGWFAEMYAGGFIEPISDIDSGFKLDPSVYTLNDSVYFDAKAKTMTPSGKLMSVPIQPLIPILYYRADLYKSAGLEVPETFDQLEANARKLNSPPKTYGIVQRGARGGYSVTWDFYPYLGGFGGSFYKDQAAGDYTVVLNDDKGRAALDYYLRLAHEVGHPKTASLDQAEVIQNLVTGKAAHAIVVVSAQAQMDDPTKSAVVDKIEYAVPPHQPGINPAPPVGHWLGGIAHNVPDDRKRAALEFLRWFQTRDAQLALAMAGAIPISAEVYRSPLAEERKFRWMKPLAKALEYSVNPFQFAESSEVIPITELGLNRAVAGELTSVQALNSLAEQIHGVMSKYGYKTGKLEPLR
jgi:multiple sugar transport system substrate-binding protein